MQETERREERRLEGTAARSYLSIDLKSFFASVECTERKLDPLRTNLVVADAARTEKTICLAVSPALKRYGISGRARLFEVVERVREINAERLKRAPGRKFHGSSSDAAELERDPGLSVEYIVAPPRMSCYMDYSTRIYRLYLRYVAPEDIHVYSIDEVFIDATDYLKLYGLTARALTEKLIKTVLSETGITATAGIGTNLYLAKVAMDIVAKHARPDKDGVRIAELDELSYRRLLWGHRPLTDFWRIGRGYRRTLEANGLYTMGDVARCSIGKESDYHNEELLYRLFGVNAELLIDHAWGYESCRMEDIKRYRPASNSLGAGQVLHSPYPAEKARLIVREMTELLALELLEKGLSTEQITLTVGYDIENVSGEAGVSFHGELKTDSYGRKLPKPAHGTERLPCRSSSAQLLTEGMLRLYDRITDSRLLVRRAYISAEAVLPEREEKQLPEQLSLFVDYEKQEKEKQAQRERLHRERQVQLAALAVKKRFGKNAMLRGMNLKEGATTIQRNAQIGGHRA